MSCPENPNGLIPTLSNPTASGVTARESVSSAHVDYGTLVALRHLKSDIDLNTDEAVHEGIALLIRHGRPLPPPLKEKLRAFAPLTDLAVRKEAL